jgi:hypothetical protein
MITAIVVMNCEVGKVHNVAEALTQLDGVAEVYSVSGEFDILAICKVAQYESLATLVTQEIAGLEGVTKTWKRCGPRPWACKYVRRFFPGHPRSAGEGTSSSGGGHQASFP